MKNVECTICTSYENVTKEQEYYLCDSCRLRNLQKQRMNKFIDFLNDIDAEYEVLKGDGCTFVCIRTRSRDSKCRLVDCSFYDLGGVFFEIPGGEE